MRRLRFSLSIKAILALAVVVLPVILTFIYSYGRNKASFEKHLFDDLKIIAEAYEGQVYLFLEMSKNRVRDFSSDGHILESLKRIRAGKETGQGLSDYLIKRKKPVDPLLTAVHIIGADGRVMASTERALVDRDFSGEAPFKTGVKGVSVIEKAIGLKPSGLPGITVLFPLFDPESGEPLGVIANTMELAELNGVFTGKLLKELGAITAARLEHETFEAYLANRDKLMITESRFIRDSILKVRVDTEPVRACLGYGGEIAGYYRDYRGIEVAGASMCLPSVGWTLLVEIDRAEALAPLADMRREALTGFFVVLLVIALLYLLFHRTVILRLKRVDDATRRIASGSCDIDIKVESSDEIGSLAGSFNHMAGEICSRTEALRRSEETLKKAQEIARMGSWDWDILNNTLSWSDEIYRIFGLKPQEFGATYEAFLSSVHPDDREHVKKSVDEALYGRKPYSIEHRIVLPDGAIRTVHEEAEVIFTPTGVPARMIGTVQDVTERKRNELELRKLTSAIENSADIIFITGLDGTIEYVNPKFEEVTGYSKEEAVGQSPRILASGDTPKRLYEDLWDTILSGRTWRYIFKNRTKSGGYYWCNAVISPILDDKGAVTHFLAVQEDITERKRSEERIERLAHYDGTTGLPNRSYFIDFLERLLKEEKDSPGTLCLIDVDQFKFFNDSYGHAMGDELLTRLAVVLSRTAEVAHCAGGRSPLVGRMSGDEFAVYFPGVSSGLGLEAAEALRKAAEGLRITEAAGAQTLSIGVVFYPEHGTTASELLTKADAAMYRAKEFGRNRFHVYRPEDRDIEQMHSRLKWKERILKALAKGRFEPWFQPILGLRDRTVRHYEALARMRDEDGSVLLPGAFIDAAERFGLVGAIDRAIIEKVMRLKVYLAGQGKDVTFSVNLSGKDLGDEGIHEFIKGMIGKTGATGMIFEITETAAIGDLERAKQFIRELKSLGCRISLDDFGVGFTSFTYLKELQVDYIKIDGSFIKRLHEDRNDQLFVKAMTDVARGLGIKTMAEFVEKEETIKILDSFGVDYAQGYLIGKPAPLFALDEERVKAAIKG